MVAEIEYRPEFVGALKSTEHVPALPVTHEPVEERGPPGELVNSPEGASVWECPAMLTFSAKAVKFTVWPETPVEPPSVAAKTSAFTWARLRDSETWTLPPAEVSSIFS